MTESEQATPTSSSEDKIDAFSVASSHASWDVGGYSQWREEAWAEPQWENWAWPPYSGWRPSYWQQAYWDKDWEGYRTPEQCRKPREDPATRSTLLSRASTEDLGSIQDQLRRCNTGDQVSFQYRLDEAAKDEGLEKDDTKNVQDCPLLSGRSLENPNQKHQRILLHMFVSNPNCEFSFKLCWH